jgi:hypothetical protein
MGAIVNEVDCRVMYKDLWREIVAAAALALLERDFTRG